MSSLNVRWCSFVPFPCVLLHFCTAWLQIACFGTSESFSILILALEAEKLGSSFMARNVTKSLRNLERTCLFSRGSKRRAPASSKRDYDTNHFVYSYILRVVDPNNLVLKLLPIHLIAATSITIPQRSSFSWLGLQIGTKAYLPLIKGLKPTRDHCLESFKTVSASAQIFS